MLMAKTEKNDDIIRGVSEKTWIAFSSVIAAIILTGTKLGFGIWSNSLGILSEALHSLLIFSQQL